MKYHCVNCGEPKIKTTWIDFTVKSTLEWAVNTSTGCKYDDYICVVDISPTGASGQLVFCQLHEDCFN